MIDLAFKSPLMILKKGLSDKTDTNTKGSSPNIASNMKQIYAKRLTAVSPEMISEEIEVNQFA